jgi:hypothetical protein
MLIKMLKISFMADNLLIMLYSATPLSLLVLGPHQPGWLIASDFKRIIFIRSVKWSK